MIRASIEPEHAMAAARALTDLGAPRPRTLLLYPTNGHEDVFQVFVGDEVGSTPVYLCTIVMKQGTTP